MTKAIWDTLQQVLQDMIVVYQSLLGLGERKRQILISAKAADLDELTKQEEVILFKAAQLEKVRNKVIHELAAAYGKSPEGCSLQALIEWSGEAGTAVAKQAQELGHIMKKLQTCNQLNTELIQQALGFIQYNINVLTSTAVGPAYVPEGEKEQAEARAKRVFDAKV